MAEAHKHGRFLFVFLHASDIVFITLWTGWDGSQWGHGRQRESASSTSEQTESSQTVCTGTYLGALSCLWAVSWRWTERQRSSPQGKTGQNLSLRAHLLLASPQGATSRWRKWLGGSSIYIHLHVFTYSSKNKWFILQQVSRKCDSCHLQVVMGRFCFSQLPFLQARNSWALILDMLSVCQYPGKDAG